MRPNGFRGELAGKLRKKLVVFVLFHVKQLFYWLKAGLRSFKTSPNAPNWPRHGITRSRPCRFAIRAAKGPRRPQGGPKP